MVAHASRISFAKSASIGNRIRCILDTRNMFSVVCALSGISPRRRSRACPPKALATSSDWYCKRRTFWRFSPRLTTSRSNWACRMPMRSKVVSLKSRLDQIFLIPLWVLLIHCQIYCASSGTAGGPADVPVPLLRLQSPIDPQARGICSLPGTYGGTQALAGDSSGRSKGGSGPYLRGHCRFISTPPTGMSIPRIKIWPFPKINNIKSDGAERYTNILISCIKSPVPYLYRHIRKQPNCSAWRSTNQLSQGCHWS